MVPEQDVTVLRQWLLCTKYGEVLPYGKPIAVFKVREQQKGLLYLVKADGLWQYVQISFS